MTRRRKDPLRPLSAHERSELERITRSGSDRADRVARAKALLAVADGAWYEAAARAAGRRSGDAVARLVARFNEVGLAALDRQPGGGPAIRYGAVERERILAEFRRAPDRERDGTATWSLSTLQRAVREAPAGLPRVSTKTVLYTLWDAGYSWQESRTWCHTGTVVRKRKAGPVEVTDPDTTPKKT
jgi:transposase